MSSLIIQVCEIEEILPHSNADKLEIAKIKGWQCCIAKGSFKQGDKCVYLPPDSIMPVPLAERLGVTRYSVPFKNANSEIIGYRIRVSSLRGERSYGLPMALENPDWEIGHDVAEYYGITKWEPPLRCNDGDAEKSHNAFVKYTDIEHYNNFPDILENGEEVAITEKVHGSNVRLGLIRDSDENGNETFIFMVGSHSVRRKKEATIIKTQRDPYTKEPILDETGNPVKITQTIECKYWKCFDESIKNLLEFLCDNKHNVIIFGEMYGQGIQDLTYDAKLSFAAFDIMVDDRYLDFEEKWELFEKFKIPKVPLLYKGPFSKEILEEYTNGKTTMCQKHQIREGCVVTPVKERKSKVGRTIFKSVSFDYLNRKGGTEDH